MPRPDSSSPNLRPNRTQRNSTAEKLLEYARIVPKGRAPTSGSQHGLLHESLPSFLCTAEPAKRIHQKEPITEYTANDSRKIGFSIFYLFCKSGYKKPLM
ncbi:hypothetical protein V6Z11_A12G093000 [Gossypium hirsutum]